MADGGRLRKGRDGDFGADSPETGMKNTGSANYSTYASQTTPIGDFESDDPATPAVGDRTGQDREQGWNGMAAGVIGTFLLYATDFVSRPRLREIYFCIYVYDRNGLSWHNKHNIT